LQKWGVCEILYILWKYGVKDKMHHWLRGMDAPGIGGRIITLNTMYSGDDSSV